MNQVITGKEARQAVLEGAKELYEAVKETYGPVSSNVGILRGLRSVDVTHDGVTVARNIELKGAKRVGAEVIKKTADAMEKSLGDGTTTVTILAYSILQEAQDSLDIGISPILLKQAIDEDAETVLSKIDAMAKSEVTKEDVQAVATISSGDKTIGELVGQTVYEVGQEGSVTIEESDGSTTEAVVLEGFNFESGLIHNYFIEDAALMQTVVEDAQVLILDKPLTNSDDIMPALQGLNGRPLLIIANEVEPEPLATFIKSNKKKLTNIVVIKSPRFGNHRTEILKDIALLTGASVVPMDASSIEGFKLGHVAKAICSVDKTILLGGNGSIEARRTELTAQLKTAANDYEKELLKQRRAALSGKVAVIKVGGVTEEEIKEKKYRVEDAVFAAQASLENGTVPGGASILLTLGQSLGDESVLGRALLKPIHILLENAGLVPGDYIDATKDGIGVDVISKKLVNLRDKGIIEPAKTIRKAIENAVSVAGTAVTMKVLIVDESKELDGHDD